MKNFLGNLISGVRKSKGVDIKKILQDCCDRAMKNLNTNPEDVDSERRAYENECAEVLYDVLCSDEEVIWRLIIALERHILHTRALVDPNEYVEEFQEQYLSHMEKDVTDQWIPFDPNHAVIQKTMQGVRDFLDEKDSAFITQGLRTIIEIMKAKNIDDAKIATYIWDHMEQFWVSREHVDTLVFSEKSFFSWHSLQSP